MATNHVLYLDPDASGRLRFKRVAQIFGTFTSVVTANTLNDGIEWLESTHACEVVYISSRFSHEEISQFLASARETKQGERGSYMIVLSGSDRGVNALAEYAILGSDGFLTEPYSAQNLAQSVISAATARSSREYRKDILAIELLAKAAIENFSALVRSLREGVGEGRARQELGRTRELIKGLEGSLQDQYLAALTERLTLSMSPRTPSPLLKADHTRGKRQSSQGVSSL